MSLYGDSPIRKKARKNKQTIAEETVQKYVLFFLNVFYLLDNYTTSFEVKVLNYVYGGDLSYNQLDNINKELVNSVINTGKIDATLDSCMIKEGDKVYLVNGENTNKTDLKLLAKHFKFIIVDNIEDAKYVIFPHYKSIKNPYGWENNYFRVYQNKYRKSDDKLANWRDKDEDCYYKIGIYQYYKNVSYELLFKLKGKIIISDLYISKLVYLLKNPQRDSVEEFNFDAIKELLMSSDPTNVDIVINILKGKNLEPFIFDILMIYYLNTNLSVKSKIKNNILSKIPFLRDIDNPSTAYLNYTKKLKSIIKLFETNNVPYNLDILINEIKNAKSKGKVDFRVQNWLNNYHDNNDFYSFNEVTSMVHKMKAIGIELTDEQIKQLINL